MKREDFLKKLAVILEIQVEMIQPDDKLEAFQTWDSLAVLSVISLFDQEFSRTLTAEELANIKTVNQLMQIAGI